MRKSHFNDEILVLLGPIISRFFACSNEEKNIKTIKGVCSSPISMGKTDSIPWMRDLFKLDVYDCRHLPVIFLKCFYFFISKQTATHRLKPLTLRAKVQR